MSKTVVENPFWKQVALSWIVVYSEEDRAAASAAVEEYISEGEKDRNLVPDALSAALSYMEDDDGDWI